MLYLASGETIPLAKVTGEIQKEGTVIRVDEKDGVSYDPVTEEKEKIVHRIVVPRGGEYKMELGDGTKIWLIQIRKLATRCNLLKINVPSR